MKIRIKFSGRAFIILGFAAMAIWAIILSWRWPADAARFPLVISSFILIMAFVELLFSLFGRDEEGEEVSPVDFQLSEAEDQKLSSKRTFTIFIWMIGFFAAIILFGFPMATPLFILLYLKIEGKETWGFALGLTVAVGLCFYVVYIWLMENSFMEGWLYEWLKRIVFSH